MITTMSAIRGHKSARAITTNRPGGLGGVNWCRESRRPMQSQDTQTEPLLPRVASGDSGAVQACLDRYGGLVWSLARRTCRSSADAEDAVQEIFVSVWRNAARFDASKGSEATFVATIARRRLIDRLRRAGRRSGEVSLDAPGAATTAADPGRVDTPVEIQDEVAIAQRAMAELNDEQRRVLQMSIGHGLSHDKIAEATGIPLGTVKTHIRRGLIRVRALLEDHYGKTGRGVQA